MDIAYCTLNSQSEENNTGSYPFLCSLLLIKASSIIQYIFQVIGSPSDQIAEESANEIL